MHIAARRRLRAQRSGHEHKQGQCATRDDRHHLARFFADFPVDFFVDFFAGFFAGRGSVLVADFFADFVAAVLVRRLLRRSSVPTSVDSSPISLPTSWSTSSLFRRTESASVGTRQPLPQPHTTKNGILIRTARGRLRHLDELSRVAAAEHNAITEQRSTEEIAHLVHMLLPAHVAQFFQAGVAEVLLVALLFPIWQVRDLQRLHAPVFNDRRSEARAEAEEQHAAAGVAAECLHGGVVDAPDRLAERLLEIEGGPASADVHRLTERAIVLHRPWVAERDGLVVPGFRELEHLADHLGRRHGGPGRDAVCHAIP